MSWLTAVGRRSRRAFTLVELLVVIGILGLLIAILLPSLREAQKQGETVKCLSNLRQIGTAVVVYATANRGSLPFGYWDNVGPVGNGFDFSPANFNRRIDWASLLAGSVLSKSGVTYGEIQGNMNVFACPSAVPGERSPGPRILHYMSHPRLMPQIEDLDPYFTSPPRLHRPYMFASIRRAAETILIFDAIQGVGPGMDGNVLVPVAFGLDQDGIFLGPTVVRFDRNWNFLVDDANLLTRSAAVWTPNIDQASPTWFNLSPAFYANLRWRHGGRGDAANFVFADGHAETRHLKIGRDADIKLSNVYVNPPR